MWHYFRTALTAFIVSALGITGALLIDLNTPRSKSYAGVVRIYDDGGGQISTYLEFYHRLQVANIPIRIEGACISACTLVLSLPRDEVCTTRDAKFGFHLASNAKGEDLPGPTAILVLIYYPPAVQAWIERHGPLKHDPIYMTGSDMIRLGVLKECSP